MLSICIPVYNFYVYNLVNKLYRQADLLGVEYEILIYDDASTNNCSQLNREIQQIPYVKYFEIKKNLGRSAIRNLLGENAKGDYLIFLDADSEIVSDFFLKLYVDSKDLGDVICGGTIYKDTPPENNLEYLRWFYGRNREELNAKKRNSSKGFIITSNNFMIRREVFQKIGFNEEISEYGHEDTLFGYDIFKYGFHIVHIDNPVEHTGLEKTEEFLKKSRQAVKNLIWIYKEYQEEKLLLKQINVLKAYLNARKFMLTPLLKGCFNIFSSKIEKNLKGNNPSLFLFDFYKLGLFCKIWLS